jgi:hypothetical protein
MDEADALARGQLTLVAKPAHFGIGWTAHRVGGRGEGLVGVVVADVFEPIRPYGTLASGVVVPVPLGEDPVANLRGRVVQERGKSFP